MIQQLFANGKHFTSFPIKAIWIFENDRASMQTGISVSSRYFKKAVDRNRIKRQMREVFRLQKNKLEQQLQIQNKQLSLFLIFVGKELPTYQELYNACTKVLDKLTMVAHENHV